MPLHFDKAPIKEATIDIQIQPQESPEYVTLEYLLEELGEQFPEHSPIYKSELRFQIGSDPSAENIQAHNGFRLISQDRRKIMQVRPDGFTFSQLQPYDRWETFCAEARLFWDIYRKHVEYEHIQRIGVRYINQLDIPEASAVFSHYLRTFPEISSDLPPIPQQYFMQLVLPFVEKQITAIINQTFMPSPPEVTSIILDIDAYRDRDIPSEEQQLWALFEQLREAKNAIFKACLTPKMEEIIS